MVHFWLYCRNGFSYFGYSFLLQFIVFLIVSIAMFIATKPFVKKFAKQKEKTDLDATIGNVGLVFEDVDELSGSVKLDGKI